MKALEPLCVILLLAGLAGAAEQPIEWTVAPSEGRGGRLLFTPDAVLHRIATEPDWAPEFAEKVRADEKGKVAHPVLANGWAHCAYSSPDERTVLVEGRGFHSIFVNGERFAGDFYRHGLLRMPLPLKKGVNHLLVRAIRGEFTIRLLDAKGECSLCPRDVLLPDLRDGGATLVSTPGAVIVLNHTGETVDDALIEVGDGRVFARTLHPVRPILPYSFVKARFPLRQIAGPGPQDLGAQGRYRLPVTLRRGRTQETALLPMTIRDAGDAYVETRYSAIDGSVQEHAVRPPTSLEPGKRYALYLSLHGAGVPALGQARAYRSKPDAFIVAPTNRRRFGFDWQDWGSLDALEALELAMKAYPIDPNRVYLTGHSMGGHGTWYLGALYPDRFAAIAPSAGWASFFTYGAAMPREFPGIPRLEPFGRTHLESATRELIRNLAGTPIYILHGEKDDNVPVREAKEMAKLLGEFHEDFTLHVQPGAGHWWGAECVDWAPLFEFCRRHVRVEKPLEFTFRTFNPAVTSRYAWCEILQQTVSGRMSRVSVRADPRKGSVAVETENVDALRLDLSGVLPGDEFAVTLDGRELAVGRSDAGYFLRLDGDWENVISMELHAALSGLSARVKWPGCGGPFKLAFRKGMVFVYGTRGTQEENAAVLAKVRYDTQVWWYRANGDVLVIPDRQFDRLRFAGRNVILYGNSDTNSAFEELLPDCPISISRRAVRVGKNEFTGDLGAFYVFPWSAGNLVGVVGATSARAMRMAQQCRYFISGSACPDWVVYADDTLHVGMEGVVACGYFDNDWRLTE